MASLGYNNCPTNRGELKPWIYPNKELRITLMTASKPKWPHLKPLLIILLMQLG
jgi:hypothetical protein